MQPFPIIMSVQRVLLVEPVFYIKVLIILSHFLSTFQDSQFEIFCFNIFLTHYEIITKSINFLAKTIAFVQKFQALQIFLPYILFKETKFSRIL